MVLIRGFAASPEVLHVMILGRGGGVSGVVTLHMSQDVCLFFVLMVW